MHLASAWQGSLYALRARGTEHQVLSPPSQPIKATFRSMFNQEASPERYHIRWLRELDMTCGIFPGHHPTCADQKSLPSMISPVVIMTALLVSALLPMTIDPYTRTACIFFDGCCRNTLLATPPHEGTLEEQHITLLPLGLQWVLQQEEIPIFKAMHPKHLQAAPNSRRISLRPHEPGLNSHPLMENSVVPSMGLTASDKVIGSTFPAQLNST